MQRSESLAEVWRDQRRPIRRILFVTYRFNFTWFHNVVLPNLRKVATPDAEVCVLATRYDDQGGGQDYGDLYNLGEWAQWGIRFRRHYVPEHRFLLHNKFILVEWGHRGRRSSQKILLGYGSGNLSYSGWVRNLETWEWTTDLNELASCRRFLQFLPKLDKGLTKFLQSWIDRLPSDSNKTFGWLFGSKNSVRRTAFSRLVRSCKDTPLALRIVSPYWDRGSPELLKELLDAFGAKQPKRIELWVDGSGTLASAAHYREVLSIVESGSAASRLELRAVALDNARMNTRDYLPLHAKLIELEGSNKTAARIWGSANFTGAAWLGRRNLESIGFQTEAAPFPEMLKSYPGFSVASLTTKQLQKLIDTAEKDTDSYDDPERPWINWAALEEAKDGRTIVAVSYRSKSPLRAFGFQASFNSDSTTSDNEMLLARIQNAYSSTNNWQATSEEPTLLHLEYTGSPLPPPQKLLLRLDFPNGQYASARVELGQPDFELRDSKTGIPLFPDLEGVLIGRKPIISPRPKISVEETPDDPYDEEEELPAVPEVNDSLAAIPDYDRTPLTERAIEIYRRATTDKLDLKELARLRSRIRHLSGSITDASERLVVSALHKALK
jgi:hypothetical protein